jgi:hypothetical protein
MEGAAECIMRTSRVVTRWFWLEEAEDQRHVTAKGVLQLQAPWRACRHHCCGHDDGEHHRVVAIRVCCIVEGVLEVCKVLEQMIDLVRPKMPHPIQHGEPILVITAAPLQVHFLQPRV